MNTPERQVRKDARETRRLALAMTCPEVAEESLTDLGNARRLVALEGERLRYCYPLGTWYVWNGIQWEPDTSGAVERLAKDTVGAIYAAAAQETDKDKRKALASHAVGSERKPRLDAMIALARSEPGVPVAVEDLDGDPHLLNCLNGVVDLRDGQLHEHDPRWLMTKLAPVEYDPDATAPMFDAFLLQVLDGDRDLVRFVQRYIGYLLTGLTVEQVLVFLYGLGANGKSTFLNVMLSMFGDYGIQAEPDLLLSKYGGAHPTGVADLKGARMVVSTEIGDGRRMDEPLVKQLTGGDRMKARKMRQDFFEFEPTFGIVVAANHKPIITGTDHAIWRRIRLVPFTVTIPEADQDPDLTDKLRGELPGILGWAVRGCIDWRLNGLGQPDAVKTATGEYRSEMDVLGDFLDQACETGPGFTEGATAMWKAYRQWCDEMGEKAKSQTSFGRHMTERGFDKGKDPETRRTTYIGIRLRNSSERVRGFSGIDSQEGSHVA